MMYSRSHSALVLSLSLLLLSACATEEAITSSGSTQPSAAAVPVKNPKQASAPVPVSAPNYDTVEACLARIPANSTPGTRMLAEGSCRREGPISSSLSAADTKNRSRVASGSVEDSLDACMARIPQDASVGQRMLASESCKRDQANQR
ncbi:MAG: conserved exported protein of unknown function [Nitrospira sp.]|jgi:hypothetical protein|nr:MAG: conserved exported protein of unknown function [Nitrospira sp.]